MSAPWVPDGSDVDDWAESFDAAKRDTATADTPSVAAEPIIMDDVAEVDAYFIAYHDHQWKPGDETGTELALTAILRLADGRWASLEAWNDYTGWGCQDGATVRIGPDRDSVIRFGLTKTGRNDLGLSLDGEGE